MAALKRLTSPSSDSGADKVFGANWNDLYDSLTGANTNAITIGGTLTAKGAFRINNPADTFYYDITPAAIAANRTLNLPLLTGTDTLAVLGLAQTFTAIQTFPGLTSTSDVTINNNIMLRWKDTGGTSREVLRLTAANNLVLVNTAGGSTIFYTDNASGAGNATARLTLTGSVAQATLTLSATDLSIGANKLKTTNLLIKEIDTNNLGVRDIADSTYKSWITALVRTQAIYSQDAVAAIDIADTTAAMNFNSRAISNHKVGSATPFVGTDQTGVAVTAAGIHAALVNLGLITA